MEITGEKNKWNMEEMPHPRLLLDMVILPTGIILLINGAQQGAGGWNNAATPAHRPLLYKPKKPLGKRFYALKATNVARMYHSSAILLPDGRVLVGGGNPNERYVYHNVRYPTELKLQAFAPQYTDHRFHHIRPKNVSIVNSNNGIHHITRSSSNNFKEINSHNNEAHHTKTSKNNPKKKSTIIGAHHINKPSKNSKENSSHQNKHGFHHQRTRTNSIESNNNNGKDSVNIRYGDDFEVRFWVGSKLDEKVEFNAYAPPFTTHSIAMNQRLLKLRSTKIVEDDDGWVNAVVEAPPSSNVAPSGYYMLFLVNGGIPSQAQWIRFVHA